jgi:hypothetical protein
LRVPKICRLVTGIGWFLAQVTNVRPSPAESAHLIAGAFVVRGQSDR